MTDFTSSIALKRPSHRKGGVLAYISLYRQRRALAALDDAALSDIGLTKAEAHAEAARPVWDAPLHWK